MKLLTRVTLVIIAAVVPCGRVPGEDVSGIVRGRTSEEQLSFDEVRRLADAFWETRLLIREGRVLLKTRCLRHAAAPVREAITTTRELIFRDDHLFVKRSELYRGATSNYFVVLGPDFSYDLQSPDYPVNVNYEEPLRFHDARVFHPRTLGLFAANLDTYYVNHDYAAEMSLNEELSTVVAQEEDLDDNGREQLYVRLESLSPQIDTVVESWYSVMHRNAPVRIIVSSAERQISDECRTKLQEVLTPAGSVFYPHEIVYTRHESGVLTEHEVTQVVEADFDTPVEDESFSLASIDTGVRAEAFVDRNRIVPVVNGQIADSIALTGQPSSFSKTQDDRISLRAWILLLNTLLATMFFVWLLWGGRSSR